MLCEHIFHQLEPTVDAPASEVRRLFYLYAGFLDNRQHTISAVASNRIISRSPSQNNQQALTVQPLEDILANPDPNRIIVRANPTPELTALQHAIDENDRDGGCFDCLERFRCCYYPSPANDEAIHILAEQIFNIRGEFGNIANGIGRDDYDIWKGVLFIHHCYVHADKISAAK